MSLHLFLIFLHFLAVSVWMGGMFFACFCLHPPATGLLEPSLRFPLLEAALGRFFRWVLIAVLVTLVTGIAMMLHVGFANAAQGWHWMMALGIAMMLAFGHVYAASYRRLARAVAAADWPVAAVAANSIRRMLAIILVLGVVTMAFATLGSGFK